MKTKVSVLEWQVAQFENGRVLHIGSLVSITVTDMLSSGKFNKISSECSGSFCCFFFNEMMDVVREFLLVQSKLF